MPNELSYLALGLSIPAGIAVFLVVRNTTAVIVVMLSFAMFLPEVVTLDAPGVPGFGKYEAASIACLFGMLLRGRRRLRAARPFRGPEALTLVLFACNVITVAVNGDAFAFGPTHLPALGFADIVSMIYKDLLWFAVPFLVGRAVITSTQELRQLLVALAVAGAIYTPLLFIELQMSPQLHTWVYGFHQHTFSQSVRGGGYRPTVFMTHGLPVALFMAWSVLAAVALTKARRPLPGVPSPMVAAYLWGFLVACKSLGSLLFGTLGSLVLLVAPPRLIARIALVGAIVVLAYPACRNFQLFPVEQVISVTRSLSEDRAQSLAFRLDMEELLTARAAERPWFGWGGWGRGLVYDPKSGRTVSVTDGAWVIAIGSRGIVGFAVNFGFLVWPLVALRRRLQGVHVPAERAMLCGLAMMVLIGVLDLIPNGLFMHLIVFFSGALHGASRGIASAATDAAAAPAAPVR